MKIRFFTNIQNEDALKPIDKCHQLCRELFLYGSCSLKYEKFDGSPVAFDLAASQLIDEFELGVIDTRQYTLSIAEEASLTKSS